MNIQRLKDAGIDYDAGVRRFVGRAQLYEKVLVKFSRDTTFARICAAYEADDKQEFFSCVHEFKGMCGNIALSSLYDVADDIVRMLRSGDYSQSELDEAYAYLCAIYKSVYSAVISAMEEV